MKTLEPFQKIGAEFLASRYHAALGDDPGLGKTVQACAALRAVNPSHTTVVCPASVRTNWAKHLRSENVPGDWDVMSYEGASGASGLNVRARKGGTDVLVLDEAHFLKNLESRRTQAIFGKNGLARIAKYKWALSGTLTPNCRPVELYPILKALCPGFAGYGFARYAQEFCGAYWDGHGLNVKGATRVGELLARTEGFLLRRTKADAFPTRTEPLVSVVPLDLTAEDLEGVLAAEDEIGGREVRISSAHDKFSQLGDTSKLLRVLGAAKVRAAAAFISDLLETVDKVVVFAHHTDVIDALDRELRGYSPLIVRGGMNDAQKTGAVALFQHPQYRVFIGQDQTAGLGINGLQSVCSTAVIVEPPWVPGDLGQLIDRLDRMGQNDPLVNAYLLTARGTLDEVKDWARDMKVRRGGRLIESAGDDPLARLVAEL